MRKSVIFLVFIFTFFFSATVFSGDLNNFKKEATKKESKADTKKNDERRKDRPKNRPKSNSNVHISHRHSHDNNLFSIIFVDSIYYAFVHGGLVSWKKAFSYDPHIGETDYSKREFGDINLPLAKAKANYMFGFDGVYAFDGGLEIGLGAFAIDYRHTFFKEKGEDDELEIMEILAVYRMSIGEHFEWGLGFGSFGYLAEEKAYSFAFSVPLKLYFNPQLSIEFKPLWSSIYSNSFEDYDVSLSYGRRYYSGTIGYRQLMVGDAEIKGIYLGFSVRY